MAKGNRVFASQGAPPSGKTGRIPRKWNQTMEHAMKGRPVDFSSYWNPTAEFDPVAPRGMKLWANVLREFAG